MAKLPTHMRGLYTTRSWKVKKRAELKVAIRAVEKLLVGSAYVPASSQICHVRNILDESKRLMSFKEWGR